MEQRQYSGSINPDGLAQALLDEWDQGETIAQAFGEENQVIVQIGQRDGGWFNDEPRQALTVGIEALPDGVRVTMGQQQWYKENNIQIIGGGLIGLFPFFFAWPLSGLFGRDDEPIDQRLPGRIWQSIERYTANFGAVTGATQRLALQYCSQCGVANPAVAERCSACGAALTEQRCPECGRSNPDNANFCLHCGRQLRANAPAINGSA